MALDYKTVSIRSRYGTNQNLRSVNKHTINLLLDYYKEINKLLRLSTIDEIKKDFYKTRKKEIVRLTKQLINGMEGEIISRVKKNIKEIGDLSLQATKQTMGKEFTDVSALYGRLNDFALRNLIDRVHGPKGYKFSRKLWNMRRYGNEAINNIIQQSMLRGESPAKLAKNLKKFLVDPTIRENVSYTQAIKKSVTGRGSLHYNALRLARTEVNNSLREATVMHGIVSPVLQALQWNLSHSHAIVDMCDVWASIDNYGIGAGRYPPECMPVDHPNGFCYFTYIKRKRSEWRKPKTIQRSVHRIKRTDVQEILSKKGGSKKYIQSQYKQIEKVDSVLKSELSKYKELMKG